MEEKEMVFLAEFDPIQGGMLEEVLDGEVSRSPSSTFPASRPYLRTAISAWTNSSCPKRICPAQRN